MGALFVLAAAIVFAVKVFGGHIGDLDLIAAGLCLLSIGLLVDPALQFLAARRHPTA